MRLCGPTDRPVFWFTTRTSRSPSNLIFLDIFAPEKPSRYTITTDQEFILLINISTIPLRPFVPCASSNNSFELFFFILYGSRAFFCRTNSSRRFFTRNQLLRVFDIKLLLSYFSFFLYLFFTNATNFVDSKNQLIDYLSLQVSQKLENFENNIPVATINCEKLGPKDASIQFEIRKIHLYILLWKKMNRE